MTHGKMSRTAKNRVIIREWTRLMAASGLTNFRGLATNLGRAAHKSLPKNCFAFMSNFLIQSAQFDLLFCPNFVVLHSNLLHSLYSCLKIKYGCVLLCFITQ